MNELRRGPLTGENDLPYLAPTLSLEAHKVVPGGGLSAQALAAPDYLPDSRPENSVHQLGLDAAMDVEHSESHPALARQHE